MSLAWTEFSTAVLHLSGPGSQRERLSQACVPSLVLLRRKEIPAEVRTMFDCWSARLSHGAPMLSGASLRQHIAAMNEYEVSVCIADMLAIYDAITRYQPTQEAELRTP